MTKSAEFQRVYPAGRAVGPGIIPGCWTRLMSFGSTMLLPRTACPGYRRSASDANDLAGRKSNGFPAIVGQRLTGRVGHGEVRKRWSFCTSIDWMMPVTVDAFEPVELVPVLTVAALPMSEAACRRHRSCSRSSEMQSSSVVDTAVQTFARNWVTDSVASWGSPHFEFCNSVVSSCKNAFGPSELSEVAAELSAPDTVDRRVNRRH